MSQSRTLSTLTRLWCGALVATCVGCQTYSPYGYGGGYSGNYPIYDQSGQVMPYGSQGMVPGQPVPQGGAYPNGYPGAYPSSGMGQPQFNQGAGPIAPYPRVPQQGADGSVDNLGPAGQFPGATSSRPKMPREEERMVPNYSDPNSTPPTGTKRPVNTPVDINDPANFEGDVNGAQQSTERLKGSETEPIPGAKTGMLGGEMDGVEFALPVNRTGIVQTAQHVEADGQRPLSPYGRAPNGHGWFRGLIDYDEQEKTWYLIYNPAPEINDAQGGMITLVEHPYLKLFKEDDVALVEGNFDPSETDHNGNPKYRISIVRRLIP